MNDYRLEEFFKTNYGELMKGEVSGYIRSLLQKHRDANCLGIGFLQPYMAGNEPVFNNTFWAVNRRFRASPWPEGNDPSRSFVSEDYLVPVGDCSIDLVFVVHELEHVSNPISFLREMWRILKVNGRIIVITAHKFGFLPFIAGDIFPWRKSWSASALNSLVSKVGFHHINSEKLVNAIGGVDLKKVMVLDLWIKIFGNVLAVEAQKVIASPIQLMEQPSVKSGLESLGFATENEHLKALD